MKQDWEPEQSKSRKNTRQETSTFSSSAAGRALCFSTYIFSVAWYVINEIWCVICVDCWFYIFGVFCAICKWECKNINHDIRTQRDRIEEMVEMVFVVRTIEAHWEDIDTMRRADRAIEKLSGWGRGGEKNLCKLDCQFQNVPERILSVFLMAVLY